MENSLAKTERTYLWLIVGGGLGVVLVIFGAWLSYQGYQRWEVRHLTRLSAAFLSGGDLQTASLSARRALQLNPRNVDATRLLAEISERAGDPGEVTWRSKVLELGSTTTNDKLALANAALRNHDAAMARKALAELPANEHATAEYESALGRMAVLAGNYPEAERHWQKAVELAPGDPAYQMQLASFRISSSDAAKQGEARAVLGQLRNNPQHRAAATRALINDGAGHGMPRGELRKLADELQRYPEATFADHLLYLEVLNRIHDPEFASYLSSQEKLAATSVVNLTSLVAWMNNNGQSKAVPEFIRQLSATTLTTWPLPPAIADSYARNDDWHGLEQFAKTGDWGAYDFVRHAYLARAFRAQKKQAASDEEWNTTLRQSASQPQALLALARLVSAWGWRDQAIEVLWSLSNLSEASSTALRELYEHYAADGDSAGLYRVLVRSLEITPADPATKNNLAQISLLMGVDPERARKLATEVYKSEPSNPTFASTYAFACYANGDVRGALAVMNKLKPEEQRAPAIAAYYGVILAAAGEKEKARDFLALSQSAKLLPEEKALVAKALGNLK